MTEEKPSFIPLDNLFYLLLSFIPFVYLLFVTLVIISRPLVSRQRHPDSSFHPSSARAEAAVTCFRPPPAGLAEAGLSSLHRSVAAAEDEEEQDDEEDADGADEDEELQF